jgi:hypothetical protein
MFLENVFLRVTNFLVAMPDSPFLEWILMSLLYLWVRLRLSLDCLTFFSIILLGGATSGIGKVRWLRLCFLRLLSTIHPSSSCSSIVMSPDNPYFFGSTFMKFSSVMLDKSYLLYFL